jgi:hypothetical protein
MNINFSIAETQLTVEKLKQENSKVLLLLLLLLFLLLLLLLLWLYSPFVGPWPFFSISCSYTQSVGLLEGGISSLQDLYLHTE